MSARQPDMSTSAATSPGQSWAAMSPSPPLQSNQGPPPVLSAPSTAHGPAGAHREPAAGRIVPDAALQATEPPRSSHLSHPLARSRWDRERSPPPSGRRHLPPSSPEMSTQRPRTLLPPSRTLSNLSLRRSLSLSARNPMEHRRRSASPSPDPFDHRRKWGRRTRIWSAPAAGARPQPPGPAASTQFATAMTSALCAGSGGRPLSLARLLAGPLVPASLAQIQRPCGSQAGQPNRCLSRPPLLQTGRGPWVSSLPQRLFHLGQLDPARYVFFLSSDFSNYPVATCFAEKSP